MLCKTIENFKESLTNCLIKKNYIKGCDNFNLSYIAEHDSWKGKSKAILSQKPAHKYQHMYVNKYFITLDCIYHIPGTYGQPIVLLILT